MAGRDARDALPAHEGAWAYDAGRRLALVTPAAREVFAAGALRAARERRARRGGARRGAARDGDRAQRRASGALRRARAPVRVVRPLPPALPDVRPAGGGVGRPARPHPHHAAPRGRRPVASRTPAGRSIAASAAAPARPPARPTCSTASCSRSRATAARRRPRCRCARCSRSSGGHACWRSMLRAGRPLARLAAGRGRAAAAGRWTPTRTSPGSAAAPAGRLPSCCAAASCARPSRASSRPRWTRSRRPATTSSRAPSRAAAARCTCTTASSRPARACASGCSPGVPEGAILVSTAAGCGAALRERDERVLDLSEALVRAPDAAAGQRRRARRGVRRLPPAARPGRARGAARPAARRGLRAGRAGRATGAAAAPPACTRSRSPSSRSSSRRAASRRSARAARASSAAATPAARCSCAARCARRSSTCASRTRPSSPLEAVAQVD